MILTPYKSEWAAFVHPDDIIESDWNTIAELLIEFKQVKNKEDTLMFNLWQMKTQNFESSNGGIRRCANNCEGVWGLVLDYDGNKTIEECVEQFQEFEFVIYTTFNHGIKHGDRFRLVLP